MCRGIPPVLGRGDQAPLDRIVVQIFHLLPDDRIAEHRLRVRALLPDLMFALGFVVRTKISELLDEPFPTIRAQQLVVDGTQYLDYNLLNMNDLKKYEKAGH
jgi:hypothetical protein